MSDKAAPRKAARARRKLAFETVDPAPALARLEAALDGATGPVAFYWPMRTEIDPRPAMERAAGRGPVCLPVTHGFGPLTFRLWAPGTLLTRDDFGTEFPAGGPDVRPATLVVPLLAFDRRGHRLGYGAGHYDRTLDALRRDGPVTAIGFAYAAQEEPPLPAEATDQPLDLIVTETETIRPGG
ncbi:MAG: 5-formyltetrahydrofolate cyclo-ligase [Paracoccaceae bacterium]|nr:5-formyltetrahydrofolate cyclo-ligase [Paracoccaceae bacterium]